MGARKACLKTIKIFCNVIPVLAGVLLLVALFIKAVPFSFYAGLFTGNVITDSFAGAIFGSIAAGSPIDSYIIGGELLKKGISLVAVTAFMVAWVTVGLVQFPAESMTLGRKFAVTRNLVSFLLCIAVAVATFLTLGVIV
ncbi:MAG: hypothetical protein JW754_01210 [Candidatus Aenigmarchaeota archaeon]|nr:hypothetical protein [Candidatus Aenigmarchaeota archaeon]